jgi:hypothetical protein
VLFGGDHLSRTSAAGLTWTRQPAPGVDFHAIVEHPGFNGTTNRQVFLAHDQGVFRVPDIVTDPAGCGSSSSCYVRLNAGLGVMQFYDGSGHAASGTVGGGAQDTGFAILTGQTNAWAGGGFGDAGTLVFDPRTESRFYVLFNGPFSGIGWTLRRYSPIDPGTISGALAGSAMERCDQPEPFRLPEWCAGAPHTAPRFQIYLDKADPSRLYVGLGSLWRSPNADAPVAPGSGPTWELFLGPPAFPLAGFVANLMGFDQSERDPGRMWAAFRGPNWFLNGRFQGIAVLMATTNGGSTTPTWTRSDIGLAFSQFVTSVKADPLDSNVVFLTTAAGAEAEPTWSARNVMSSRDGGQSWRGLGWMGAAADLPPISFRQIEIHPAAPHVLYAATGIGLFVSENGGATWTTGVGLPNNVDVSKLFWMNQTLVAVTHGRGMFSVDVGSPPPPPAAPSLSTLAPAVPTASSAPQTLRFSGGAFLPKLQVVLTPPAGPAVLLDGTAVSNLTSTVFDVQATLATPGAWTARLVNIDGQTTATFPFTVSSAPAVPGAPANLSATVVGNTVTLQWAAGPGPAATQYRLEAGSQAGASNLARVDTGSPATTVNAGAIANGTYFVRARALNAIGTSAPSNEITFTVPVAPPPPGPPGPLVGTVTGLNVSLTWGASAGSVSDYVLEAGTASGLANLVSMSVGSNTGFGAANVAPGTYFVRVRARNAGGLSAPSNEVVLQTGCSVLPAAPALEPATVVGTTVSLGWTVPPGSVAGYVVEAGYAAGTTIVALPVPGPVLSVIAPPGRYFVRVRATNACGIGAASNEVPVVVP